MKAEDHWICRMQKLELVPNCLAHPMAFMIRLRLFIRESTLLHSIWGFSDDFAWGLASANPCTVKTLESATFRKCNTDFIQKNIDAIKMIGKDTTFVPDDAYVTGDGI